MTQERTEISTTSPGDGSALDDGLDVLRADHRRLRRMLADLGSDSGSNSANVYGRRRAADALVNELQAHCSAEQRCLRPILDELPQDGETLVQHENADAERIAECLRTLLEADPMDSTFAPAAAHLLGHVERHIARQEEKLFPLLVDALGPDRLAALGGRLRQVKMEQPRVRREISG